MDNNGRKISLDSDLYVMKRCIMEVLGNCNKIDGNQTLKDGRK